MYKTLNELIEALISSGVLKTERIIDAFKKIDRADFVSTSYASECYGDYPLPIGFGQTISQPTTVAFMLEHLDLEEGQRVLDVGSGSGYTTALLANIVGVRGGVVGLERIHELVKFGQNNIAKYNFKNARIKQAGKEFGMPGEKFDRILVSASADNLPLELMEQLKDGGRMVIPVGSSIFVYEKDKRGSVHEKEYPGFAFVPLVK